MVNTPVAVIPKREYGRMGPKMQALTPKMRAFVQAMLDLGMTNHTRCAMIAGYSAASEGALRVAGHRLAHDERVQAAIQEEAGRRMKSGAIMATNVLQTIAETQGHKDQLKAALAILDRSGLHAVSESRQTHEVVFDEKGAVVKIVELCKLTGQDPQKLLGAYNIVLDAEYTEIAPETEEEPFDPLAGLEDE